MFSVPVPWRSRQETLRQRSSGRLGSSVDSPSDDYVAGCSVDTDSNEMDDVSSPTGIQRFFFWLPRFLGSCKKATHTEMSTRFWGHPKPDSTIVQCKNCGKKEYMKGIFQNTEHFVCSV